ncbi:MAG: NAD(P)/FAD-dependent oxidoreductase [Eubacterium sp.]|nr:NAD(P)/FAD-dependent oxidoreductase [Eubacterium sp.]
MSIVVVGGGAAGLMAAAAAAQAGANVLLLERNEKLGKKLYITGKGRCNVTNACDTQDLFGQILRNAKFMYSAIYTFDNFRVMDFFEQNGTPLKTERGGRVFPVSDHASDIIRALSNALERGQVDVRLHTRAASVSKQADGFVVKDTNGASFAADKVILATGGLSYPSTGSTGDGYGFAQHFGHTIQTLNPSLTAMVAKESYIKELQGLSLKNVRARIFDGAKLVYDDFGEMLFTHFGVSGPLMLSASAVVNDRLLSRHLQLFIDLKPALTIEQLDQRILRDFEKFKNKQFKNALGALLPSRLIPVAVALSQVDAERKVHEITKEERKSLLQVLKNFPATLTGFRDFKEAIITRGGVHVKEIDPSTMESKLVKGLYFAGEMLDVDALTGGYNLQAAWSSGYLAGSSAAQERK